MRNSQNHKKAINLFLRGCNFDINKDLSSSKEGFYKDAHNFRLFTGKGSIKKIYGEKIKYSHVHKTYTSIGAVEVINNLVEVWVRDYDNRVIFRVNGIVMLDTDKFLTYSRTRPLQMHKSDNCKEGLFFMTNNEESPYIFSVTDIMSNYTQGTQKYFADFNPQMYSVNLATSEVYAPDIPVFRRLLESGSLPFGQYAYSIRYVDADGNRTNWSMPTPMIPVPLSYDKGLGGQNQTAHPYNKTFGGNNLLAPFKSPYNIEIEFRVNNTLDYSYIEVRRIRHILGLGINTLPEAHIKPLTNPLIPQEISTRVFIDNDVDWENYTDDEDTDFIGYIKTCKSLRYFNGHLVLGNIKTVSKELQDGVIKFKEHHVSDPNTGIKPKAFPIVEWLGDVGYNSPHNTAYKKSYMGGEKYGLGVACIDRVGGVAFVVPIKDNTADFTNYPFPDRRVRVTGASYYESEEYNYLGKTCPRAADIDNDDNNGQGQPVFEKFEKTKIKKTNQTTNVFRSIHKDVYNPYTPKFPEDSNRNGLNVKANAGVAISIDSSSNIGQQNYYNPDFGVDYFGMGIAITGLDLDNFPDWISAFSIVRTDAAGRIVCQGINVYGLDFNEIEEYKKIRNTIDFYSDDLNNGLIGAYTSNSLVNYKYQPVSPLGYFSEMYSGFKTVGTSRCIDSIVYARELVIDPNENSSPLLYKYTGQPPFMMQTNKYWTKFGVWRNSDNDLEDGDKQFDITSDNLRSYKTIGRQNYLRITLNSNIYKKITPQVTGGLRDVDDYDTMQWHEPFYVGNIIDDSKDVPDTNITDFILTGTYIKIQSLIGKTTGTKQVIRLVDERFVDCCVNTQVADNKKRPAFVYIKDMVTRQEKRWIDITGYSATTVAQIISDLNSNGVYVATDPISLETFNCYGVYTHLATSTIVDVGAYQIEFNEVAGLNTDYCIPTKDFHAIVKYDNRFPIKVFGGDTIIGESNFAWIDGITNLYGSSVVSSNINVGFPYPGYLVNPANQQVYQPEYIVSSGIRQIIVNAIIESKVHLPYAYQIATTTNTLYINQNFPRQHYVIRPSTWALQIQDNFAANNGNISNQYQLDYPKETDIWNRGGIRFWQGMNIDYSKGNNYDINFSKPKVGFVEKNEFCTQTWWSRKKNINVQDDPNLKTFIVLNRFDISDGHGEIKFLYDNDSEKGNNLYALTENGVCLLITDKRTISDTNAQELFVLDSDRFIKGQYWLDKIAGCTGEMWRGIAEYGNMLFYPSAESIYLLQGMQIFDILRENEGSYYERLHPELQKVRATTPIAGVYNISNKEYWLYIGGERQLDIIPITDFIGLNPKRLQKGVVGGIKPKKDRKPKTYTGSTYVFKSDLKAFTGTLGYRAEKFICVQGSALNKQLQVLLLRNYETYETNKGNLINNLPIEGRLLYIVSPDAANHKEFIDMTINSSLSPSKIELSNTVGVVEATQTKFKNYGGWYTMTPRKQLTRVRFQGRALIVEIYNSDTQEFEISTIETGYKIIR